MNDYSHREQIFGIVIASVSEAIQYELCRNSVPDCFAGARNDGVFLEKNS